jgi:pyruvate kinase
MNIYCTLGPASLNEEFLTFLQKKKYIVSLVRINLSHIEFKDIEKTINLIRKYCTIPICIDTEGAQIRAKVNIKLKKKKIKKNSYFYLNSKKGYFNLYPQNIFKLLKNNDVLNIGFEGLLGKIVSKSKNVIKLKSLSGGVLENNKGVHVENRNIKIEYLTDKDKRSIKLGKQLNIKDYALSFTNTLSDLKKFQKLLPKSNKIFKIESDRAVKNINIFFKYESNFLIDRGDLSKSVGIEKIPVIQRSILKFSKKNKNNISIATNFLESMIEKPYPTRAEVNDVYNALEMGAKNLVLAGETAIGKYPKECVELLERIIKTYKKYGKIK